MRAKERGGQGVEGLSEREKEFMDVDNSVVIVGVEDKGTKWQWKNTIKKDLTEKQ